MIKVLFICHGNICRSPMAEFLFRDMAAQRGLGAKYHVASSATSREEIGNPVHPGTCAELRALGISTAGKYAVQMTRRDYDAYDYLIGMDRMNYQNMLRIAGGDPAGKMSRLLDWTDAPRDVADPWYTGDFSATLRDITAGCTALLRKLEQA